MRCKLLIPILLILLLIANVSAGLIKEDLKDKIKDKTSDEKINVIFKLKEQIKDKDISDFKLQGAEVKRTFKYVKAIALKLPVKAVEALAKHSNVEVIESDYEVKTVLSESSPMIGSDKVHLLGPIGDGVNVHVIDTGITSSYITVLGSTDFTGEGIQDLNGHGTHVASTIASMHSLYKGVSPGANIYNVKVLDKYGSGYASDVMAGIEWSITKNADIISMSLGAIISNCDGTDIISLTVDEARAHGIIPVVAAGNSGPDYGTISSPGCAKGALTVGAVDKSDVMAGFSSRGPTSDGRIKPDIVAPGVKITAPSINDQSLTLSGTSMATPHVSGTLALLISDGATKEEAENYVLNNADDLGQTENYQGKGRVNALRSYNAFLSSKSSPEPEPTPSPEPVPTEPTPTEPIPIEPLPTEPSPDEPVEEPIPENPIPEEPTPIEPVPSPPITEPPVEDPETPEKPELPIVEPEKPRGLFRALEVLKNLIFNKKTRTQEKLKDVVEKLETKIEIKQEELVSELIEEIPPGPVLIVEQEKQPILITPTPKGSIVEIVPKYISFCGDGVCQFIENVHTCPKDCEQTILPPTQVQLPVNPFPDQSLVNEVIPQVPSDQFPVSVFPQQSLVEQNFCNNICEPQDKNKCPQDCVLEQSNNFLNSDNNKNHGRGRKN